MVFVSDDKQNQELWFPGCKFRWVIFLGGSKNIASLVRKITTKSLSIFFRLIARKIATSFSFVAVIRDLNEACRINDVSRGSICAF